MKEKLDAIKLEVKIGEETVDLANILRSIIYFVLDILKFEFNFSLEDAE